MQVSTPSSSSTISSTAAEKCVAACMTANTACVCTPPMRALSPGPHTPRSASPLWHPPHQGTWDMERRLPHLHAASILAIMPRHGITGTGGHQHGMTCRALRRPSLKMPTCLITIEAANRVGLVKVRCSTRAQQQAADRKREHWLARGGNQHDQHMVFLVTHNGVPAFTHCNALTGACGW